MIGYLDRNSNQIEESFEFDLERTGDTYLPKSRFLHTEMEWEREEVGNYNRHN